MKESLFYHSVTSRDAFRLTWCNRRQLEPSPAVLCVASRCPACADAQRARAALQFWHRLTAFEQDWCLCKRIYEWTRRCSRFCQIVMSRLDDLAPDTRFAVSILAALVILAEYWAWMLHTLLKDMKANLLLCFIVPGLFDTPQFCLLNFPSLTDFVKRKKKNLAVYSKSDRNENHR